MKRRSHDGTVYVNALRWVLALVVAFSVIGCGHLQKPQLIHHLSGESASLESLRGRVVLLNFWAGWCKPCMKEIPVLIDLAEVYGGRVMVVAVFYQPESSGRVQVDHWQSKNPEGFTQYIWYGNEGLHWEFPTRGILPTTYVLDARGELVEKVSGSLTPERAQALIEKALSRSNP